MTAIEVNNLTKVYRLYKSSKDRLREIISFNGRKFHREFYALRDVSFKIEKQQTVGIIGINGSGKSTLLKIICGVLQPTSGTVEVNGQIAALLELGAGFHPEFTGRENVFLQGSLMGFSRSKMEQLLPDIEAFADIGGFIDQPVKTYSSGMFVRLAFAVAVNIDPEILVVDEALSVGDMFFKHRSLAKMESFRDQGKTILLVTHDINLVKNYCDSVILLNDGNIVSIGDPEYVTEQYMMLIRQKETERASNTSRVMQKKETNLTGSKISFGTQSGQIFDVSIMDKELRKTIAILSGDMTVIRIHARIDSVVKNPNISFILRDQRGYNIYGTSTMDLGLKLEVDENHECVVLFSFTANLAKGSYSLVVRLADFCSSKIQMPIDKQVGVGTFQIIENKNNFSGVVDLNAQAFQDPGCVIGG